ncbi:hypothetical protein BY458DRAFT_493278 [Sporodiniella umbellata]|nr:hypothetical protein BY458DRAFT_493278 [Sporodiniella umbellata]
MPREGCFNKVSFDVLPALKYLLKIYESRIAKKLAIITRAKEKARKNSKQRIPPTKKGNNKDQQPKFQPSRLLSLFSNLGFKWYSIKIYDQIITGIFGKIGLKNPIEVVFDSTKRCFYDSFDCNKA